MIDARRFRALFAILLLGTDTFMLALAFGLAHRLRVLIPWPRQAADIERLLDYLPVVLIFVVSNVFVFFLLRLYHLARATSRVDEFYTAFVGVTVGTLLAVAAASLTLKNSVFEVNLPRAMMAYAWLAGAALVIIGRWLQHQVRNILQSRGYVQDRVVVVGAGDAARLVIQKIQSSPYLGYRLLGVVNGTGGPSQLHGYAVLGCTEDLPRLIETHAIDEVILAVPEADDAEMVRLIALAHRDRVSIKVFPDLFEIMAAGVTIDDLGGLPLLSIRDVALRGWKLSFKRAMDIVLSAISLALLSPILLLVAILIKLDSPGPAFFVQERMGLDSKPFRMFKFRSMRQDAEAGGPGWTVKDDPRRTRVGAFIRRFSIDEFPNLINVLFGDMSLVGPRPEQPAFVEQFRQLVPRYMDRHHEKSGITGWAQVNGLRGDTSIYERTKYDLWYIENWSVWLDIKILIRTTFRFLFDRSAY
ncbi:MAG: undecaprenyl-phosphate glucose phosphotransferase [Anaerolineales bacterium]|nr:undecaprenyl-phosphate glucose phosphotransferase [Anaerolineales bacterium]